MNRQRVTKTETSGNTPEIRLEGVRPLIRSFLAGLTEERWKLIRMGTPDDATQVMLADLLRKIVDIVIKAVLAVTVNINVPVPEECVQSSVTNTLSDSLSEALTSCDDAQSVSTEELSKLIVEEVTESVASDSSGPDVASKEPGRKPFPPIQRLDSMVKHTATVLKAFSGKVENACRPQRRRERAPQQAATEDRGEPGDAEPADKTGQQSEPAQSDASEECFVVNATIIVRKIINKEMEEITEPFLHKVPDTDYEVLQTESTKDIEAVAGDIAQTIAEEVMTPKKSDASEPESPEPKQPGKMNIKIIRNKIKNFFTKGIAKVLIHRIVVEVKEEHQVGSQAERGSSTQSLLAEVDTLLLKEDGDKNKEDHVVKKFKKLSSGRAHVFTKDLSDLLYLHITQRMQHAAPEKKRKTTGGGSVFVPQSHANMYSDIKNKVYSFLVVMNYWVNSLAASHSKRVTHALMDVKTPTQIPAGVPAKVADVRAGPAPQPVQDVQTQMKNRLSVNVFVARLANRIFTKARVVGFMNPKSVIQYLFAKTWAEVESLEIAIPENLDKIIFTNLCKRWGSAKGVLIALQLEEAEIENYILSCFRRYVIRPKRSAKLFCFARKAAN